MRSYFVAMAIAVAMIASGCGEGSQQSITGPDSLSAPARVQAFETTPAVEGITNPHDAPKFTLQGNDNGHLDVNVTEAVSQRAFLRLYVERKGVDNQFTPVENSPFVRGENQDTYFEIAQGPGQYRVRLTQTTVGGDEGVYSDWQYTSIAGSEDNQPQPAPEKCYGWRLVRVRIFHVWIWIWKYVQVECAY